MNEKYDHLWSDMNNWSMGIYKCKDDPRLIVPKIPKWAGRTLNFAHKSQAIILLTVTIIYALIGPISFITIQGPKAVGGPLFYAYTFFPLIPMLIFYYSFELKVQKDKKSNPPNKNDASGSATLGR